MTEERVAYVVKYGYTDDRQYRDFFNTLEEANAFALNEWEHHSAKEKEERYCYVVKITTDDLGTYEQELPVLTLDDGATWSYFTQCHYCKEYFNSKAYEQQKDLILTKDIQC